MGPNGKQKIEIEKLHRGPLPPLNQAVAVNHSDFLGTALNLDNKFRYLLRAERQPLEVRGILDGVCNALDCQIGNVVSFISLQGNDANELSAIAMTAVLGIFYPKL